MKKIYDAQLIEAKIENSTYKNILSQLNLPLFLINYEKNEFVTSPFQEEDLFQIVVSGSLNIYFIRDDGTRYSLSVGNSDYILGDIDFYFPQNKNTYAEATEELTCIAFSIHRNKEILQKNNLFLQLVGTSLAQKMVTITQLDASPTSLTERVLTYMEYKCTFGVLKGLENAAFHLNCSPRQLQRIMNECEKSGIVEKIGKGTYQLNAH